MIKITKSDPHDPQITALLQASHALMQSLFPPEDNFFLSIDDLCAEHIHFFAAREGHTVLGTGALRNKGDYGEVKSMFTSEQARGKGVAAAILRALEDEAIAQKIPMLKLETGNVLYGAHRLYERAGFTRCGPFGTYVEASSSIFMEKAL